MTEHSFKSPFLKDVAERGYIHQCTDFEALDNALQKEPVTAYIGFDATAPSLHVGNLIQIMWLRKLQQYGHKPLIIMGGATTRIGDPSGRDESRQLLSDEKIEENMRNLQKVFEKFLTFGDGPTDAKILNNYDWFKDISYIDLLRTYGPHFTINRMLTMDSVRQRLDREQPLTFLEFNYTILQSVDFLELYRREKCTLQLGGSEQWGNIINGADLVRRFTGAQAFGLTSTLITTADGKKMGKSMGGAVWLDEDFLPPFDFWQYWRNVDDRDVIRFLKLFTDIPVAEIEALPMAEGADINAAKTLLADTITQSTHGEDVLAEIHVAVLANFQGTSGDSVDGLPEKTLPRGMIQEGQVHVTDIFMASGFASSKGEARRLIKGGGARIQGETVQDTEALYPMSLFAEGPVKVSSGKKRHVALKLED